MQDLDLRLAVAKAVGLEAGQLAKRRFLARKQGEFSLKGHQDYLTETDGEVEKFVISALSAAFPQDGFIGEESGGSQAEGTWIIDPIDGTANFARGIPFFCVSIGFYRRGRVEVGVIAAPMQDELFAAALGRGATVNGQPMQAASTADMRQGAVEVGWNTRRGLDEYLKLLTSILAEGPSVRRSGSGSLGIVYVGAGRQDAYVETHINSWDVAAGLCICREAGAKMSDFFAGDGLHAGNALLVSCPGLAPRLSAITGLPVS